MRGERCSVLIKGTDLLKACRGELLQGDPEQLITGFSIDSRTAEKGDFFVPLRGEKEDGHRYLSSAAPPAPAAFLFPGPARGAGA